MKIRVVLVEPEHDGNIGLIARSMKNFGYEDLWIVKPRAELGIGSTMCASHAQDLLAKARVVSDLDEALKSCDYAVATTAIVGKSSSNLIRKSITLREFAEKAAEARGKLAILFGRESKGLTNMEISRCELVVNIPTDSRYRTLNVSASVAITLYELRTTRKEFTGQFDMADQEARKRLLEMFEELSRSVNLPRHRIPLIRRALSNVISRSLISRREASLIAGVIRKARDRSRLLEQAGGGP